MDLSPDHMPLIPSLEDRLPEGEYKIVLAEPDIISEELNPHHHHYGRFVDFVHDIFMADAFGIDVNKLYTKDEIMDKSKDFTLARTIYANTRCYMAYFNLMLDERGLSVFREQFPPLLGLL